MKQINRSIADFNKLSRVQLAACFGVNPRTVSRRRALGLPLFDGKYRLPESIVWRIEHEREPEEAASVPKPEGDSPNLEKFRRERWLLARIERKEKQKQLLPRAEVEQEWTLRASELRQSLMSLRYRLVSRLEGLNREQMFAGIDTEVRDMLNTFVRNGNYTLDKPNEEEPPKTRKKTKNSNLADTCIEKTQKHSVRKNENRKNQSRRQAQ